MGSELVITHFDKTGLFSNCSVMLGKIIDFYNEYEREPNSIDTSKLFKHYKKNFNDDNEDITNRFFRNHNETKSFHYDKNNKNTEYHFSKTQYSNYKLINHSKYKNFIDKYFYPSNEIFERINFIENKYNIDYDNICVLFYRGNDKCIETFICDYDRYIEIANKILNKNPSIKFLIQSDETEFIETILKEFPNNSFYFKDEIIHIKKDITDCNTFRNDNYIYGYLFFAIIIIISRCKIVVCNTTNCSLWIALYRNHCNDFYQDFNNKWFIDYE